MKFNAAAKVNPGAGKQRPDFSTQRRQDAKAQENR
jgi:hypothetical protein